MNMFKRRAKYQPSKQIGTPEVLPEFDDSKEGIKEWAGQWKLDLRDMTWKRDQHSYHKGSDGKVRQYTGRHTGPMVRPEPLQNVRSLEVPLGVLKSHPDTPNVLPADLEGTWTDTNPAWPEVSIDYLLARHGLHGVWDNELRANEEFTAWRGKSLLGTVVYVKPGNPKPHKLRFEVPKEMIPEGLEPIVVEGVFDPNEYQRDVAHTPLDSSDSLLVDAGIKV